MSANYEMLPPIYVDQGEAQRRAAEQAASERMLSTQLNPGPKSRAGSSQAISALGSLLASESASASTDPAAGVPADTSPQPLAQTSAPVYDNPQGLQEAPIGVSSQAPMLPPLSLAAGTPAPVSLGFETPATSAARRRDAYQSEQSKMDRLEQWNA